MYSPPAMAALCRNEDWSCVSMQSIKIWRFLHSHWMGPWRSIWPLIVYTSGWWNLLIFARHQQWSWMLQRQRQHIFHFKNSQTPQWSTSTAFRSSWRKPRVSLGLLLTTNYIGWSHLKNSERSKWQEQSNSTCTWTYPHWWLMACFPANSITAAVSGWLTYSWSGH